MQTWKSGTSRRAAFDSGLRNVMLGLVLGRAPAIGALPVIPLRARTSDSPHQVDPNRVRLEVQRALASIESSTGVRLPVEAIEYVPDDSEYYDMYYILARELAQEIISEGSV